MSIIKRISLLRRPQHAVEPVTLAESRKLMPVMGRRSFLRGTVSLGAVSLLGGCDISNDPSLQAALR
jgi:hypothetical protein